MSHHQVLIVGGERRVSPSPPDCITPSQTSMSPLSSRLRSIITNRCGLWSAVGYFLRKPPNEPKKT